MASHARQELTSIADDLDAQAEQLERTAAAKRGDMTLELEAMICRMEAAQARREIERWKR